jgi:hypothetical protein
MKWARSSYKTASYLDATPAKKKVHWAVIFNEMPIKIGCNFDKLKKINQGDPSGSDQFDLVDFVSIDKKLVIEVDGS